MIELKTVPPADTIPPTAYVFMSRTPGDGGIPPDSDFVVTGLSAYGRVMAKLQDVQSGEYQKFIFRGTREIDWWDPMTAKVDTTNYNLLHDSLVTLKSGNDSGIIRTRKFWHPLEKTMQYEDAEFGARQQATWFCSPSKNLLGNVFVYDLFEGLGLEGEEILASSEATLYWHEK